MGARVYIPGLGRFLSVDPVQGGTPNNYMYASDPVNQQDFSGQCAGPFIIVCVVVAAVPVMVRAALPIIAKQAGKQVVKQAVKQAAKQAIPQTVKSAVKRSATKSYQVYAKTQSKTGTVYTGRTGGYGAPQQNIYTRNISHHMNSQGYGELRLLFSTTSRSAARGAEQYFIDLNGGARSVGGTSGNAINGISPLNPNGNQYIIDFLKEYGGLGGGM